MKEQKKTITLIIAIALVIVLIGGGTYAYWQWETAQNTNVTFTVPGTNTTMTIDGGGNITNKGLAPAACTNTTYAIQRKIKVTAVNDTTTAMTETIELKVDALAAASGHTALNSTNKASLKWALVRINSTEYEENTWSGCETPINSGNFSNVSAGDVITVYNSDVAAAATTSTGTETTYYYYELYIWIDSSYTGEPTIDTTSTDPLQGMTLNLSWQGSMTNTPT